MNFFNFSAVHLALNQTSARDMINELAKISEKWELDHPPNTIDNGVEKDEEDSDDYGEVLNRNQTYVQQLKSITNLLEFKDSEDNLIRFVKTLGNDIAAVRSAPTALFSFLKAQKHIEGFCETNDFQRTLELAMSFGGDSDTIMSMAGAIAGAYYGESNIPKYLINLCEGIEDAQHQADEIFKLLQNDANSNS